MPTSDPNLDDHIAESLKNALRVAEAEIRHAVACFDAVVVPKVRSESAAALRQLAAHLDRLGEELGRKGNQPR